MRLSNQWLFYSWMNNAYFVLNEFWEFIRLLDQDASYFVLTSPQLQTWLLCICFDVTCISIFTVDGIMIGGITGNSHQRTWPSSAGSSAAPSWLSTGCTCQYVLFACATMGDEYGHCYINCVYTWTFLYNMVMCLQNVHEMHCLSRPRGQGMGY